MTADRPKLFIIGAGGHARVLLAALAARGLQPLGCIALAPPMSPWPSEVTYIGSDAALDSLDPLETKLINGVGSVGSSTTRQRIFEDAKRKGFSLLTIIHPTAFVAPHILLGEGVQIMAGAVVQTGCSIGANTLINTGVVLDHDCQIGSHCHIATGAVLSGGIRVGDGAHVGTGAAIIHDIKIGAGSIVGAGAAVINDTPPGSKIGGIPARPLANHRDRS